MIVKHQVRLGLPSLALTVLRGLLNPKQALDGRNKIELDQPEPRGIPYLV
jgi:hypothetical protein